MRYLAIALLLCCTGCSTMGTQAPPPDTHLAHDSATPLFATDSAAISDADIARILDTRIELPPTFRVGLVYLDHERIQDGRRHDHGTPSQRPVVSDAFFPLRDHERIYDVSYLPQLMMPRQLSAGGLRAAAARYQADWVLVFETGTTVLTKNKLLGTDKARAYCTAECVVLDVRTGLIAFSSRSQVSLERDKVDGEWSLNETAGQVEQDAIAEAMTHNVDELVRFLDQWRG